jgi:hypothetical protein
LTEFQAIDAVTVLVGIARDQAGKALCYVRVTRRA